MKVIDSATRSAERDTLSLPEAKLEEWNIATDTPAAAPILLTKPAGADQNVVPIELFSPDAMMRFNRALTRGRSRTARAYRRTRRLVYRGRHHHRRPARTAAKPLRGPGRGLRAVRFAAGQVPRHGTALVLELGHLQHSRPRANSRRNQRPLFRLGLRLHSAGRRHHPAAGRHFPQAHQPGGYRADSSLPTATIRGSTS